ncbi:MAG: Fic family protein [Myxococcales bacterium]|nr:Fic family protein [Myxococcales bacterium]MCB9524981.1 Fic family protein [Myxococcales bacterium]
MTQVGTDFIRALEEHRAAVLADRAPDPHPIPRRLMLSWIHHDNMLEGRLFQTAEIVAAMDDRDDEFDKYLHPLLSEIRRYRDAILFVQAQANEGPDSVSLGALKTIHKMLTPDAKDRGGLYRRNSPVHRDYYQRICTADKVPYSLRKLFEFIEEECELACDPVAFAADVHHRLMVIYPFRRNPGTTARLFTNLLLMSRGYPPVIVPAHQRREYYDALCRPDAEPLTEVFRDAVGVFLERSNEVGLTAL